MAEIYLCVTQIMQLNSPLALTFGERKKSVEILALWPMRGGSTDIIAGSPPISLSLIVGKSKCDAQASVTRQNVLRKPPNPPGYPAF